MIIGSENFIPYFLTYSFFYLYVKRRVNNSSILLPKYKLHLAKIQPLIPQEVFHTPFSFPAFQLI